MKRKPCKDALLIAWYPRGCVTVAAPHWTIHCAAGAHFCVTSAFCGNAGLLKKIVKTYNATLVKT